MPSTKPTSSQQHLSSGRAQPYEQTNRPAIYQRPGEAATQGSSVPGHTPPGTNGAPQQHPPANGQHSGAGFSMGDLRDSLHHPTQPATGQNIFNPSGANNNCAHMGLSYVTGLSLDEIKALVGPQAAPGTDGLSEQQLSANCQKMGIDMSASPPPAKYIEGAGEIAAAYKIGVNPETGVTLYHVVAVVGGTSPLNYQYRDYQTVGNGQDVTDEVRQAGGPHLYLYRPDTDDKQAEQDEDEEPSSRFVPEPHPGYPMEEDEEEGQGEAGGEHEENGEAEEQQQDGYEPTDAEGEYDMQE
ncbi:hypothetical protein LTR10_015149 [Elasticomyces elasticus]|uniref:Peptidase C39-like domain-containing protein n=1 Tax=Exophiala sideris TaxID=1016849 RepID=A0ABR0JR00_9EURO|nr:hypothetical protein LTR10_015149 [Elasticomyces elasticus]KAK5034653.1 hypothetical protein LTR13_006309 [Exophiala sideris]KAK5040025.1 hypothetical protein LTS07_000521 [Exophiala sideris]KAK5068403.1 hypothetical protein LTR69_000522 [Exophiala sideris]KAK5187705.1 hypothetical protein LTR44_000522 [Eurotiomycetes sp. CCFEE 6388]